MKDKKHIIIVDDSECKADDIKRSLQEIYPNAEYKYFEFPADALQYLMEVADDIENNWEEWLLMLDMQMAYSCEEDLDTEAGYWMLRGLERVVSERFPVIIVSSEDVDDDEMFNAHWGYLGSVGYDSSIYLTPKYKELLETES